MSMSPLWGSLVKVAHYNSRSIPSASPLHLLDKTLALHSTYRSTYSRSHHPFIKPECLNFSLRLQGIKISIWIRTASETNLGQVKQISFRLPTLGCQSIILMKNKTPCSFNCCPQNHLALKS